jgi:hypothetical protein
MKTLNYPKDNFDAAATFKVAGVPGACYLFCAAVDVNYKDYTSGDDYYKIFVLQKSGMIKAVYSEKDVANITMFAALTPIAQGEVVEVDGKKYAMKILGNYSDAGYLIPCEGE